MVSSADSSLPPTITVLYQEYRGEVSLRQLARDLDADLSNVRKAKKLAHPKIGTPALKDMRLTLSSTPNKQRPSSSAAATQLKASKVMP